MAVSSVVIDDLDVVGVAIAPAEADAELIVDADVVLSGTAALEGFEASGTGGS